MFQSVLLYIHNSSKRNMKGVDYVKVDRKKIDIARARACIKYKDLIKNGIPKGTLSRALNGYDLRPETIGRIAKALGVDVTEILLEERS